MYALRAYVSAHTDNTVSRPVHLGYIDELD